MWLTTWCADEFCEEACRFYINGIARPDERPLSSEELCHMHWMVGKESCCGGGDGRDRLCRFLKFMLSFLFFSKKNLCRVEVWADEQI